MTTQHDMDVVISALEGARGNILARGMSGGGLCLSLEEALITAKALRERMGWQPIETAPKGIPVLVEGGLAMRKTGDDWYSGMESPLYQRPLQWQPKWWQPIPTPPTPGNTEEPTG